MALPFEIDLLFPNVSQKAWLMTDPSSLPLIRKARIWGQHRTAQKKSFITSFVLNLLALSPFPEGGWWRASFEPHGPKYTKHMWVITLTVETTVKGSELSALFCARPHGCLEPMALPFEIDLLFPNVSQKAWLMTDPSSLPLIRKARIWGQLWDRLFWIQKAWITEWLRAKKSFIMSNYLNMLVPFHGPSKLCSWFERRRAWLISGR